MCCLTSAQSSSIPYINNNKNTVLVSPASTGKTLSYLLPLVANLASTYHLVKVCTSVSILFATCTCF